MPCYNLRRFASPKTLQSISPEVLVDFLEPHRSFIAARGFDIPDRGGTITEFDHLMLTSILMKPDESMPEDLVDALYYTHEMGCDRNIDTLVDLAQGMGLEISVFSTAMDIAMRVWATDRAALVKKHAQLHIYRPHTFEHYQADNPVELTDISQERLDTMQRYLDEWFTSHKRGDSAKLFVYPSDDEMWFLIRHGDPYRRESAVDGYKSKGVLYRPETFDIACYVPSAGELRIYAKNKGERDLYRREFGRLIARDTWHFPGVEKYTLDPIKHDGERCLLSRDADGIDWVMLTELKVMTNAPFCRHTITYTCPNVFAALRHREVKIEHGDEIQKAKFLVQFSREGSPRPVTITPPNKLQLSRDSDGDVLSGWLRARGFITDNANGGDSKNDNQSQTLLAGM